MMTAFVLAPGVRTGREPAAIPGVDRAIRVSTAVAVLAVAGVAAYVSYWHAYAVVCAHGESGVTARLEPATIDGLVYASSMVNLYAARHRLPVPALARWLLALGIVATLAANMAQGWSHGPVGAVIAAWPAVSLVGSYELLVWMIRTAAAGEPACGPDADQGGPQADDRDGLWSGPGQAADARMQNPDGPVNSRAPDNADGPLAVVRLAGAVHRTGPADRPDHPRGSSGADSRRLDPGRCQRRQHQRGSSCCLPRQRPKWRAAVRTSARGHVRQDVAALGTQPQGRSETGPEPGTLLRNLPVRRQDEPLPPVLRQGFSPGR
jgi:hypothetical protein